MELETGSTEVSKHYGIDEYSAVDKILEIERALEAGEIRFIKDVTPKDWNKRVSFEDHGLIIPNDLSRSDHRSLGLSLAAMKRAIHYWIGDWIRFGIWKWGDEFFQDIDPEDWADGFISRRFGFTYKTAQNDLFVCDRVDIKERKLAPSFGHSDAVAVLAPRIQERVLRQAKRQGWNVTKTRAVKRQIRQIRGEVPTRRRALPLDPDRRFRRLVGLYLMVEDALIAQIGGEYHRRKKIQRDRIRAKIVAELTKGKGK